MIFLTAAVAFLWYLNPRTWLTDILTKLVNRWPTARIYELMPWVYAKPAQDTVNM